MGVPVVGGVVVVVDVPGVEVVLLVGGVVVDVVVLVVDVVVLVVEDVVVDVVVVSRSAAKEIGVNESWSYWPGSVWSLRVRMPQTVPEARQSMALKVAATAMVTENVPLPVQAAVPGGDEVVLHDWAVEQLAPDGRPPGVPDSPTCLQNIT